MTRFVAVIDDDGFTDEFELSEYLKAHLLGEVYVYRDLSDASADFEDREGPWEEDAA